MLFKAFLAYLFIVISFDLHAQHEVDSLKGVLNRQNIPDTSQVDALNKLAWYEKHKAPEQTVTYAEEALQLAKKINYKKGEGEAYNYLGIGYTLLGDYVKAMDHLVQALEVWNGTGELVLKANTINNIGNLYQIQGDFAQAATYLEKALSLREQLQDTASLYASYNSLGTLHKEQSKINSSLLYFKKFLALANYQNDLKRISSGSNNIGLAYRKAKQYDSALLSFEKALAIKQQFNDEQGIALSYRNIGDVYQLQSKYDIALTYYQKSLAIREKIGYNFGLTILLKDIAQLLIDTHNAKDAIYYAQRSVEVARQSKMKPEEVEALKVLSAAWKEDGNLANALAFYQQHVALKDSLFNAEKNKQLNELQIKYASEQKEKELLAKNKAIDLLTIRRANDQKITIIIAIASLLLIGTLFILYQIKKRAAREGADMNKKIAQKNTEIEAMNRELEKRMLRAQMDPHFIFNSLNSIQHFITINDKRATLKYLNRFSKLIRRVLENSVNTIVTLEEEIELLEDYIELEAIRHNNKFDYQFTVDPSLDISSAEVPFLLLQPYVENAIQHGLHHKETGGRLNIRFTGSTDLVHCEVEDNGIGRTAASGIRNKSHRSRGMSVTLQRLENLNENYKHKTLVTIEDLYDEDYKPAGTKVKIDIPKEYDKSNLHIAALADRYN